MATQGLGTSTSAGAATGGLTAISALGGVALATGVGIPLGIALLAIGLGAGGGALFGRSAAKKQKESEAAYERTQEKLAEQQRIVSERAAYDLESQTARQQAQAIRAAKPRALPFAPAEKELQDAMYIGGSNAYDRWHQEQFGG